jgi:hypothetical protein
LIFDALKFLRAYNIPHTTEGSRARRGWVQLNCPRCGGGERGWDLGINLSDERVSCWRCKGTHIVPTIQKLLRVSHDDAEKLYKQFQSRAIVGPERVEAVAHPEKAVVLPYGVQPLNDLPAHKKYLVDRRFDPALLERCYGLMGLNRHSEYGHRIIAPITFEGRLVSYQGRIIVDIEDKSKRYKACAMKDEAIHHKHLLYGWDQASGDSCVVVEGITDQWRLGPGALATFGTGFKTEQAVLLQRRFKRVFIMFDPEPQAQCVAEDLGWWLAGMGTEVLFPDGLTTDPGDLKQEEADAIMRELGLTGWNER